MAKTTRTTTVTLSTDDLWDAVAQWARSKGLVRESETVAVHIDTKVRTKGYGMHEYDEHYSTVVITATQEAE